MTQEDENVGPGKAEIFLLNLATILAGMAYAPVGWALTAVELAGAFSGLIYEEPEALYEWPHAVRWWEEGNTQPPPNLIQGEVYILVENLTEGLNSIPITFEVDTCLAFYESVLGYWWPGATMTESLTLNITWTTTPDDVNLPPETPSTPSGPTSGYTLRTYAYNTSTTDPNGDDVRYEFDWGDDSPNTITGWYGSGETATAYHYWTSPGTYQVKVRAQESYPYLLWSNWSPILEVSITTPPQPPPVQEHSYVVMGGITTSCGHLNGSMGWTWMWTRPFATRPPDLTPLLMSRNITFSDPDPVTGVVYLTVPAETYVGLDHTSFSSTLATYVRFRLSMQGDGYGWLFTGTGTSPILGDVDYYTFGNSTGVYWGSESPKAGELAAITGALPSFGPDGVAGTADDGFGDGTPDPPGSSILYLPTTLDVDRWNGTTWIDFFEAPWPQVLTTGTAYNIVTEEWKSTVVGEPWEFFAGLDHPEYDPVPWTHAYSNAYVTYVCTWSVLNVWMPDYLHLDIHFKVEERLVREDCVIADIQGEDEEVNIYDVRRATKAWDTYDEDLGYPEADDLFDAAADLKDPRGYINIFDIRRVTKDYGKKLTPNGIT